MVSHVLTLWLAASALQVERTQPPAEELLVDQTFDSALAELRKSPRVHVETIGQTHLGRPVRLIIVALPEVIGDLETYRGRAAALSVPHIEHSTLGAIDIREKDIATLVRGSFLPVLFAGDSWGHEAAQVEGLLQAAKTLAFDDGEEIRLALSKAVALIVPLMNPDGRATAIDEWKRTPLSSGNSGVGNAYGFMLNRDFMHATQPESRAIIETTLRWRPVAAMDQHEDMFNLGVRLREVCFVEPFELGFDIEEHPLTRSAIVDIGFAIAERWRKLGFNCLFDPAGDKTFAPVPERGEALSPVASSGGRLNFMWSLHGIPGFITESARTPGSQSWEDRVEQKASSVIATLLEVSRDPVRYADAVHRRKLEEARRGGDRFVLIPATGQPADGLRELLDLLDLHDIAVFGTEEPYPAFVVPLAQAEAKMARHLLLAERSRLNTLGPALGVEIQSSDNLTDAARAAFLSANLVPAFVWPTGVSHLSEGPFLARPTVNSTALVNRLLASNAASVSMAESAYRLQGSPATIQWQAKKLGVPLETAPGTTKSKSLSLQRVAVYNGQGISPADSGEIVWALESGAFPYSLVDADSLPVGLDGVDVLVVPNGAAGEIVHGWNPEATARRSPWEPAEPARGLGPNGLAAIRDFVQRGGNYVGIGAGGALLAGAGFLEISTAESVPANVGLGLVRLKSADWTSPLWFGYPKEAPLTVFFLGPPGSPAGGFAFKAGDAGAKVVALYDGADEFLEERSFLTSEPFSAATGNAALIHERYGEGQVVLFGFAPTFRGQWKATFRFLYNAFYLSSE